MFFSGKISNSVLAYLHHHGVDLDGFFDLTDIPTEFLKDTTGWLEAAKVEEFLRTMEAAYCKHFPHVNFIEDVGHRSHELRSWGVLDSVLRMMQKPQDILTQPQRFISYFVSPAPPLGNIKRENECISFEIPISHDEFPWVTTYLRAALEALPTYMGESMASVSWQQTKIVVNWSKNQTQLFVPDEKGHNVNPEFMKALISSLESVQRELEEKKKQLKERDEQIRTLMEEPLASTQSQITTAMEVCQKVGPVLVNLQGLFMRLIDYQTRAQQLVTLLGAHYKENRATQEAMRRVDWNYVREQFQSLVDQGVDNIRFIKNQFERLERQTPKPPEKRPHTAQVHFDC